MANKIGYICNFNDVSLNSIPFVQVYLVDPFNPKRSLNIFALARRSARSVSSAFYQARNVYVGIYITAPSRAQHDQAWDALMSVIQGIEGTLVIEQSGGVRAYTCTFGDFVKNTAGISKGNAAPPSGGFADYVLQFECSDSFGYDTAYSLITNSPGLTSNNVATQYTQNGSADSQVPFIQAKYTALSGASAGVITVTNDIAGQSIVLVARAYSVNDLLQIDLRAKTVRINGTDVDFSGPLLEFGTGLQRIRIQDNFTTRTFDLLEYVYNRYN